MCLNSFGAVPWELPWLCFCLQTCIWVWSKIFHSILTRVFSVQLILSVSVWFKRRMSWVTLAWNSTTLLGQVIYHPLASLHAPDKFPVMPRVCYQTQISTSKVLEDVMAFRVYDSIALLKHWVGSDPDPVLPFHYACRLYRTVLS